MTSINVANKTSIQPSDDCEAGTIGTAKGGGVDQEFIDGGQNAPINYFGQHANNSGEVKSGEYGWPWPS